SCIRVAHQVNGQLCPISAFPKIGESDDLPTIPQHRNVKISDIALIESAKRKTFFSYPLGFEPFVRDTPQRGEAFRDISRWDHIKANVLTVQFVDCVAKSSLVSSV